MMLIQCLGVLVRDVKTFWPQRETTDIPGSGRSFPPHRKDLNGKLNFLRSSCFAIARGSVEKRVFLCKIFFSILVTLKDKFKRMLLNKSQRVMLP